jgi:hypothetical protein
MARTSRISVDSRLRAGGIDPRRARQSSQSRSRRARCREPSHHVRHSGTGGRVHRGADDCPRRAATPGADPSHWLEQCHRRSGRGGPQDLQIACVQNLYNLVQRADDPLVDSLAQEGIAYVPFFPLGGFTPLQSGVLNAVAQRLAATPLQVALAWLLLRAPNMLLIPGTSSLAHLRENLAAAALDLPREANEALEGIVARPIPR